MRKIKVLHILHSFGIGGMEKGIAMLINHASHDFEHCILCLTCSGASKALISPDIQILEMNKRAGNSIWFLFQLAAAIRKLNPDVVHTRNWGGMDAIIAARLAGISRIVHGEHGWGMADPLGASDKRIKIRRWLSYLVREFTAVSMQIKDWLETTVAVHAPVTQIYNGIEFATYPQRDGGGGLRRELGLPATAPLIGIVGRLDPIKDHPTLFAAFALLRQQHPDCQLVVVGDGPELSRLQSLATEGIHLLGMRSDIPQILRDLDIFALSSLNEGIPNTILEAMACGLPIVATAVGGSPEIIKNGQNGMLVAPQDFAAMAGALARYLSDPALCCSHGERNRQTINSRFSISAMVSGYESVWRRAAYR